MRLRMSFRRPMMWPGVCIRDQASVIGNTVKKGVNLNTAFTEFFPDIIREFYIGTVDIRGLSE